MGEVVMAAAECQSRQLAEVIATLDGAYLIEPIAACTAAPRYRVYVDHQLGLEAVVCTEHEQQIERSDGYRRSVHLGSGYWRGTRST